MPTNLAPTNIWGHDVKIPVLGTSGEFRAGKTLFMLSICPDSTKMYDFELSSASYEGLIGSGSHRVDVAAEMLKEKSGHDYSPIDVWEWWRRDMLSIQKGQFAVIAIDPSDIIERGLVEWVMANPQRFGKTAEQYRKAGGLFWGDVNAYWLQVLVDLASRCETFAFASHMRYKWEGGAPTKEREAKGKEVLMQISSLYIELDRAEKKKTTTKIVNGKEVKKAHMESPQIPRGKIKKERVSRTSIVDGKAIIEVCLPPYLKEATPDAIRGFILNPVSRQKSIKADQRLPVPEPLSEDERLQISATVASDNRATAEIAERTEENRTASLLEASAKRRENKAANKVAKAEQKLEDAKSSEQRVAELTEKLTSTIGATVDSDAVRLDDIAMIERSLNTLDMGEKGRKATLAKRGVEFWDELSAEQAASLRLTLANKIQKLALTEETAKKA